MAPKGDILYAALEDQNEVKEMYRRKAEMRNYEIMLKNYIPPQYFARYNALNKLCSERRKMNPLLKTEIRFNMRGMELLTKGEEEGFRTVDIKDFCGTENLPAYDASIKWRAQTDRQPRRRLSPKTSQPELLSVGSSQQAESSVRMETEEDRDPLDGNDKPNTLRRQRSQEEKQLHETKRQKVVALIQVDLNGDFQTETGRQNLSDIL